MTRLDIMDTRRSETGMIGYESIPIMPFLHILLLLLLFAYELGVYGWDGDKMISA